MYRDGPVECALCGECVELLSYSVHINEIRARLGLTAVVRSIHDRLSICSKCRQEIDRPMKGGMNKKPAPI